MKIKVLVCNWNGSQHVEEREVPDDYLAPPIQEPQEQTQK